MNDQIEKLKDNGADRVLKLNFSQLLEKLLKNLNDRGRQVITGRFNLDGEGFKTLEKIGRECGITRERIRQIQVESVRKLKSVAKSQKEIGVIIDGAAVIIKKHGGAMSEDHLLNILFDKSIIVNVGDKRIEFAEDNSANRNILSLVLDINDRLACSNEKEKTRKFWSLSSVGGEFVFEVISAIKNMFEKKRTLLDYKSITEEVNRLEEFKGRNIDADTLKSYLNISKELSQNPFGLWGITEWEDVNPKGVRGKIYLILRNSGKPLHFAQITKLINETVWPGEKERNMKKVARSETVHNELIKDKRFVLVGRGTYALKEWGYNPGTVLDVIIKILSGKKSMTKEDIVKEVLKERFVKVNTIIFNLHNSGHFERKGDLYQLKSDNVSEHSAEIIKKDSI